MNRCMIGIALLFIVLTRVCSGSDARFKGGDYDGYDQSVYIQFDSNAAALVHARFKGGDYDGYDRDSIEDTTVKSAIPQGNIIISW